LQGDLQVTFAREAARHFASGPQAALQANRKCSGRTSGSDGRGRLPTI
jgi:hypothetical protein